MDLTTGALDPLLSKFRGILEGEYKLQMGARKEIDILASEFEAMREALRKVGEVPPDQLNVEVRSWAKIVRELAYDVEDVLDSFLVRDQGSEPTLRQRLPNKMSDLLAKAKTRHQVAQDIKDIKARVKEVAERRSRYLVDVIPAQATSIDPRLAALYTKATNLVGIDGARDELIERLTKGNDMSVHQLMIVSIVGSGGIGKTTLAKAVYDKVKAQFACSAFVFVSRSPDMTKIFKDMLYDLDSRQFNYIRSTTMDEGELMNLVRGFLQNNRYFIIIDDIWEARSWETIKSALIENNCGSRVILTTRINNVAISAGDCYKLKPLSENNSKQLFYTRVFGGEGKTPNVMEAEVSNKILRKCGGLPLAIITMASLLEGKPIEMWYQMLNSIGFGHSDNMQAENTLRILLFSYYDLPHHLRPCLLYLSIYPQDHVVNKNKLIWSWIAEGFVDREAGIGLFKNGESYFHELINRNMIQPIKIEGTDLVYGCRVHDLILDLIRSMPLEENFVSIVNETGHILPSGGFHCRRLAIQYPKEEQFSHFKLGDDIGLHLRSFYAIGSPIYMIPSISSFKILRVLGLESCGSMEGYNLEHIGQLCHLRFMGLINTSVRKLPKAMGHLRFLQTLDLEGTGVEELPKTMGHLTELMCLNADWTTRVPDWIGKLTSLQQLVIYPGCGGDKYSARWFVKELGNLRELRVLRFLIKAQDEGQLRDLLQSLSNLEMVEVLHFDYYGVQLNRGVQLEPPAGVCLPKSLRSLELSGLEFSKLPVWINARDLPNLCHLWLMLFDVNEQDFEVLGQFPVLCDLHMLIVNTERGHITPSGSGALFQTLKFCSVTIPLMFRQGAMPRLEVLDFSLNVRLKRYANNDFDYYDLGLVHLPSLRQVVVEIICQGAVSEEMEKAEAALKNTINIHPNHPILTIISPESETDDVATIVRNSDQAKGVTKNKPALNSKSSSVHVGIDEPSDRLIKKLFVVDNEADNSHTRVLSILRSAGQGKTTLAEKVFGKLSPRFDCGAFVLVGQNPDLRKVFTDILTSLDRRKYSYFPLEVLDLMELIGLVRKSLVHKRFFVVVDDIWDLNVWEIIKCAFIENTNHSAVLTTSHRSDIAINIGGDIEQIDTLLPADSKNLFCKKLFGSEDKCPPHLENMCAELVKKCDGTLSVIDETVTLLESIPQTVKDWQPVYNRRIFALSYPKLPDHLQKCLLYFSMFRKGYEISGERLVWAWIAEDFIQKPQAPSEQTLQDVGESYLSELVRETMIEAMEVDAGGKALSCRVYDFVHDLIIPTSTEGNFVAILDDLQNRDLPDTVHRLSIQGNTEVHSRHEAWRAHVKSLVVTCDSVTVASIPEFPSLLVMDLTGCGYLKAGHLKSISKITSLKYLAMGAKCMAGNNIDIFAKLKDLHTLDLSASDINQLPKSVFSLTKLERLCVNGHMKISDGIAKLSALQELGDINIDEPELLKKLSKLKKLRVLRIAIWSWDESLEAKFKQLYCDNLRSLVGSTTDIQCLSILTSCSLDFMGDMGENWAPQSLQKLEIRNSAFDTLPNWFGSLSNISSLTIEVYKLSQVIIDTLGKLSTLGSLSLTSKQVPEGYFVIDSDRFKSLASLKLVSNAIKEIFVQPLSNDTQQLKRLTIVFQASRTEHVNKDFCFGLENLSSLKHIRVEIICFNASEEMVTNAESAVQKAISSSHPDLEIRRLFFEQGPSPFPLPTEMRRLEKGSVIADEAEDLSDTEQKQMEPENFDIKQKRQKKKSSSKKIRVTGKLFREKRRKELLERLRPFLDSTGMPHFVPSRAP